MSDKSDEDSEERDDAVNQPIPDVGQTMKVEGVPNPVKVTKIVLTSLLDKNGEAIQTIHFKGLDRAQNGLLGVKYVSSTGKYEIMEDENIVGPNSQDDEGESYKAVESSSLGVKVRRFFPGIGWFDGVTVGVSIWAEGDKYRYKIKYEAGRGHAEDEEELDDSEFEEAKNFAAMVPLPTAPVQIVRAQIAASSAAPPAAPAAADKAAAPGPVDTADTPLVRDRSVSAAASVLSPAQAGSALSGHAEHNPNRELRLVVYKPAGAASESVMEIEGESMVPARGTSQEAAPGPAPELTALSLGEEVTSKNNPALGISSRYSGLRDVAAVMDGENGQRTGRTIPVKNRGGSTLLLATENGKIFPTTPGHMSFPPGANFPRKSNLPVLNFCIGHIPVAKNGGYVVEQAICRGQLFEALQCLDGETAYFFVHGHLQETSDSEPFFPCGGASVVSCISKATRPDDENGIFFVAKKLIGGARSLSPVGADQVALALEVDLECMQAILESAEDNFTKILANLGSPEPACVVFTQENVRLFDRGAGALGAPLAQVRKVEELAPLAPSLKNKPQSRPTSLASEAVEPKHKKTRKSRKGSTCPKTPTTEDICRNWTDDGTDPDPALFVDSPAIQAQYPSRGPSRPVHSAARRGTQQAGQKLTSPTTLAVHTAGAAAAATAAAQKDQIEMLQHFLAMGAENSEKHTEAFAVMASKQVSAFERQQDIQSSLQRQQTLSSAFGACSDPNQFQARMFQALVTGDSNQVFGASDSEDMSIGQRQSQLHPQMQRTLAFPEGRLTSKHTLSSKSCC